MSVIEPEIRREYPVSHIHEIAVEWNGWKYIVIYGEHIDGWFIAIPNHGVCIETSDPSNYLYNSDILARALYGCGSGAAVAKAVYDHWEAIK